MLYGYVRLRNSAPRNSVVLLDEPELHLNPRLVRGLARFYFNRLVRGNNNQLWLISHSDTLLRESVNLEAFDVFRMRRGDRNLAAENQTVRITTSEEVERIVIELVGDLAAYRPGAKVVLFEGSGDVEFDVRMVARLFPDFDAAVNAIAAGNTQQVTALHGVLDRIGAGALGARFYAIRDKDTGVREEEAARVYTWNAYHIENHLLDPEYVYRALTELSRADASLSDAEAVRVALEKCAAETIPDLVRHELTVEANDAIVRALRVGGRSDGGGIADGIHPSIEGSLKRIAEVGRSEVSLETLRVREQTLRAAFEIDLGSGDSMRTFRGRDVLKRFVERHIRGASYEAFRDLVLARMKEDAFQPAGMTEVLTAILEDTFP